MVISVQQKILVIVHIASFAYKYVMMRKYLYIT